MVGVRIGVHNSLAVFMLDYEFHKNQRLMSVEVCGSFRHCAPVDV